MTEEQDYSDQRNFARHPVSDSCTLTFDDVTEPCRLLNASLGGVLVAADHLPAVGESAIFAMPNMKPIEGKVVRRDSGASALSFDPDEAKAVGINDMITFVLNRELLGDPVA